MLVLTPLSHAGPSSLPSSLLATALLYLFGWVAKDCVKQECGMKKMLLKSSTYSQSRILKSRFFLKLLGPKVMAKGLSGSQGYCGIAAEGSVLVRLDTLCLPSTGQN